MSPAIKMKKSVKHRILFLEIMVAILYLLLFDLMVKNLLFDQGFA